MYDAQTTIKQVKDYYGKVLASQKDLKTSACCSDDSLPQSHKDILSQIEDEILARFYGCGSPIPAAIEGCTVLDLGSGTGRDVYLASALVGEEGKVIGVDMTDEQLKVARKYVPSMTERFGFETPNVEFRQGYIEDLASAGIADNSIDLVISNCVINLSPDKQKVFSEIFRVLKPGGELFFSDVFSGRRVPDEIRKDPVLHGECLAGALYTEDFRRMLASLGCPDYRQTNNRRIEINNPTLEEKAGMIDFYSITVRAFKLPCLEDICEDYGQIAIYKGSVADHPHYFDLDDHHRLLTGKPMLVCGNTAAMLQETRFKPHFEIIGDRSRHYGAFDCSPAADSEVGNVGCC